MKHLKRPIIYVPGVIIAIGLILGGFLFFKGGAADFKTVAVERTDLVEEVSVTGRVVAKNDVKLAFVNSGKISRVYKDVGQKVISGEAIVVLDNSEVYAKLLQAEADRDQARAKLDDLERGTRPEEIEIARLKVVNAETALTDTKYNVVDKIKDAFVKSDDAIRGKVDQLMTNPKSSSPKLNVTADQQVTGEIESSRQVLENTLNTWAISLTSLAITSDLENYAKEANANLKTISIFLDSISLVVNALVSSSSLSQTTIDSYKADILAARTNASTATSNLTTALEKFRSAHSTKQLEENNLTLSLAGATLGDLEASKASLKSAEANVLNLESQMAKTIIRAPFAGVISLQDAKVGEIATAGKNLVSVIGSKLQIEAYVPEADIAKIHLNDLGRVTLDAYGDEAEFEVRTIFIDPAETVIENVSTYRILLEFTKLDERIRSGMTANIDIVTMIKTDILALPQRAVMGRNGDSVVRILEDGEIKETPVKTGLRSVDGQIEIIEGLSEGREVVVN